MRLSKLLAKCVRSHLASQLLPLQLLLFVESWDLPRIGLPNGRGEPTDVAVVSQPRRYPEYFIVPGIVINLPGPTDKSHAPKMMLPHPEEGHSSFHFPEIQSITLIHYSAHIVGLHQVSIPPIYLDGVV